MKLEKEVKLLPVFTCDEFKNKYKNITIYINILELTKDEMEIIKKGQVSKLKMTLEYQEPILDEAEKKYLSGVIAPFRDRVEYIKKKDCDNIEYIAIIIKNDDNLMFPNFKKGTMYKGMELNKEYKPEELGI